MNKRWPVRLALLLAPCLLHAEEEGQRALPTSLAVADPVTMTEADEAYVATALEHFKSPDGREWTFSAEGAYGLTDRWRAYAEIPYAYLDPREGSAEHGIGDVETSIRYAAVDYRKRPFGLDLGVGLIWPTGSAERGLGDGETRVEPSLTASQWLGPLNLELHAAWAHAIHGSELPDELEYNLVVIYPVRKTWLVLEGNGTSSGDEKTYTITPEIVARASERVQWLVGAPIGTTHDSADYGVIAGVTIEFEHAFHRGGAQD